MSKVVNIKQHTESASLSKAQKKFNSLIKKIDVQKKILQHWEENKPKISHRIYGEYQPIVDSYNEIRVQLVQLFDEAHADSYFKKNDKAKLSAIICSLAIDLIQKGAEELKEIYARHNGRDFDSEQEDMNADVNDMMKSMMENMFDMEFDEHDDLSSPEKMRETIEQKMQAKQAHQEAQRAKRKKTPKQIEKEAREKEEAQNASKSIQDVFRKLVAALHPDREPDEAERERKTKLMQRVNEAYGKKDLLQLLALQLEIEQIDQSKLNTIAEDKLKHFNKVLQEQLIELEEEISDVELPFRLQLNVPPYLKITPEFVLKTVSQDIRSLKQTIKEVEKDIKDFQNPANLKALLKTYRI